MAIFNALNVYNKTVQNNKKVTDGLAKLSSGLRINQAADDSSGLAISEKMRNQIRGLAQAEKNIQEGISLIQTAESGLAQIANPNLVRLRELAVQAANDTLTENDRQLIQQEVNQIEQGINDIANNTKFNKIHLLNVPNEGEVHEVENAPSTEKVITVQKGETVTAGYIEVTNPPNPSIFEIMAFFGTISGAVWPDLNIKSPNGEVFGFSESILPGNHYQEDTTNTSSTKATYTGYGSEDEKMTFEEPISGKWYIEIRHTGGDTSSTFTLKSNYLIHGGDSTPTTETIKNKPALNLQIGANVGDTFLMDLSDVRTKALGIEQLTLDSRSNASQAIALIDKAVDLVSSERTKFGAYQNLLEHIENNVANYKSNLSSAESKIRDLDMSKEITALTKQQVLLQSSQAMLVQANQLSQSLLELLK